MISFVRGELVDIDGLVVTVDNGGIGFAINSSMNTIKTLPSIGQEVMLYTILIPKEDSLNLYGFSHKEERRIFDMLLGVSGVGPKAALAILSTMTVDDVKFALAGADSKAFANAPGVGKKTAERIIIDLKDKIDAVDAFEAKLASGSSSANNIAGIRAEVMDALVSLGYSSSNAARALDKMTINESTSVEQLLTDTLKQMSFL
ncbi:MAG: Holliday junction branch migration protein RuvA [Pseudobutyrivibrio sp.]|nr:Holliday junction branch migration protein RuvA [Pseudobutyrivibrio sp.]